MFKKLKNDKRGVFGLTAVQQFFAIILGIALLAYVIVIIMGTLADANIVPKNTLSGSSTNESTVSVVNETGVTFTTYSARDGLTCSISACRNASNAATIAQAGNWTSSSCTVTGIGSTFNNTVWRCDYTFTYNEGTVANAKSILTNTSTGIAGFFGAINPVYAILAILVIILILVVLVRVVQTPGSRQSTPSL